MTDRFWERRDAPPAQPTDRLRLLTYNIQTGVETSHYRHYVTKSWKHILPHSERFRNLNRISALLRDYDLVGLQEVDGGSLRSGFVDQTQYLAVQAGFPYWHSQTNRRMGPLAQHSNGLLSRLQPADISEYKLPGLPGRGVLVARFGSGPRQIAVLILHLALSRRGRLRQVEYVAELVNAQPHAILMGDMNCQPDSPEMRLLTRLTALRDPEPYLASFPSWQPQRSIDHILVTGDLKVRSVGALRYPFSDHLPVAMEVSLPDGLRVLRESVPCAGPPREWPLSPSPRHHYPG
ncbi:MAG: endonuclease/exonuclease/phosphatase family protein [Chromatiales bacterium]|nr:endonuclease/exonuclease/phosphatase family protein [Chromatiales bacterium]